MDLAIAEQLLAINRTFYQQFADQFDATRQRLQPGVSQILAMIPPDARVLDLGCGNGEFWRGLVAQGFQGEFVGLDFSDGLLTAARQATDSGARASFYQRDLSTSDWDAGLTGPFDFVVAFAVFHHLPALYHAAIFEKVQGLLAKTQAARFIFSNWQFLNSARWRARIQDWERVKLNAADVAPGDYLLDWRRGGVGYRYVHHFDETELSNLARATGFQIATQFHSDGKEGNLAIYQILESK